MNNTQFIKTNERNEMVRIISQSTPVARKDHSCMACESINDQGCEGLSFADLRKVVEAKKNGFKVKKGDIYVRQFNEFEGRTYTFIAIPAMHEICLEYDFYAQ